VSDDTRDELKPNPDDARAFRDGSDGRTYIASWHGAESSWVVIHEGTMRWRVDSTSEPDEPGRYAAMLALLGADPSQRKGFTIPDIQHVGTKS
jgi:hypothetical protein